MADPSIANVYRAQVRLKGSTGMPEDVFVNSFAFRSTGASTHSAEHAKIVAALDEFYTTAPTAGIPLDTYLGGQVPRTSFDVVTYDTTDPVPRQPLVSSVTYASNAPSTSLPAEVALCLSFHGPLNVPSERGRIYFGPLNGTVAGTLTGGDVRPSSAVITALTQCATRMAARTDITWGLISQLKGTFTTAMEGWVDNAFDTQRRRGVEATTRTTWT